MSIHSKLLAATVLAGVALAASPANAGTVFTDRGTFQSALTSSFTDDFGAAYGSGFNIRNNAAMSAVVGQTTFTSTGFAQYGSELNFTYNGQYCAGCNGSFTLGFGQTSFGTADGVFGAGVDFTNFGSPSYTAFVTYGDGSTQNVALGSNGFFGVTSNAAVKSIAFGLPNGGTTTSGSFAIDNLTIGAGAVPEPATWAMMILGVGMVGGAMRRRTSVAVRFA